MNLPIKTRILEWAIEKNAPFTAEELSELLKVEYNNERTTILKNIEKQLETYVRVDFIKVVDTELDKNGDLVVTYQITDIGREKVEYIPGHGNKLF